MAADGACPMAPVSAPDALARAVSMDGAALRPREKDAYVRAEIWRPHRSVAAHLLWGWYGAVKRGETALQEPAV